MTDHEIDLGIAYLNGFLHPFSVLSAALCNDAECAYSVKEVPLSGGSLVDAVRDALLMDAGPFRPEEEWEERLREKKLEKIRSGPLNFSPTFRWQAPLEAMFARHFEVSLAKAFHDRNDPQSLPKGFYSQAIVQLMEERFAGETLKLWEIEKATQNTIDLCREIGGNDFIFSIGKRFFVISYVCFY